MDANLAPYPGNYPKWINKRIGAEVLERRKALRLSADALGKAAGVSDQTILNIEQALYPKGSWTGTLARICLRFGTGLPALMAAAEQRDDPRVARCDGEVRPAHPACVPFSAASSLPGLPHAAGRAGQSRALEPDDYAQWINDRIGEEVRERRKALPLGAVALGRAAGMTDQAILNIERGVNANGSRTGTLARICMRFGIRLPELIAAAERRS